MARLNKLLIVLIVAFFFFVPDARAQSGVCPPGTFELGTMAGTWPDGTKLCVDSDYVDYSLTQPFIYVKDDANLPCGQQAVASNMNALPTLQYSPSFFFVPPVSQDLNGWSRIRFYLWGNPSAPGSELPEGATVTIRYFDSNRLMITSQEIPVVQATNRVSTYVSGLIATYFYDVYIFDIPQYTGSSGGYVEIKYDPNAMQNAIYLASFQVGRYDAPFPQTCDIPNASVPATITPTPTPAAGYTPQPTPQSYPTSPYSTPRPTATPHDIEFITVPAPWTPTPWKPYTIPTVSWPTIEAPTVIPTATPAPTEVFMGDVGDDPGSVFVTLAADWNNVLTQTQAGASTTLSVSTGIDTPTNLATEMISRISVPISYAKAVLMYMPNSFSYLLWSLSLAAWVGFVTNSKFFIGIAKAVFELLRRLWGMLPFVG